MPHVNTFKAGQRVTVRELRGCMEKDGIQVGDVGMTMRMVNGALGVQFDRLNGVFIRYAPGIESMVVNCCDALESVQNVTPVRLVVVSQQPRRDGRLIRWGMFKRAHWACPVGSIGNRRVPGMTAKGVKWALAHEEVRA